MKTIILEIRAAEGGNDSKLLVQDQMDIYIRCIKRNNFQYKVLEDNPGSISL